MFKKPNNLSDECLGRKERLQDLLDGMLEAEGWLPVRILAMAVTVGLEFSKPVISVRYNSRWLSNQRRVMRIVNLKAASFSHISRFSKKNHLYFFFIFLYINLSFNPVA